VAVFAYALSVAPVWAVPTPFASILVAPEVPGAVWDPGSVVVDPLGAIAVVDSGNDRVRLLAADGTLLADLGSSGSGPDELIDPQNAAFGPDGYIYVADSGNGRVQVYQPDGDHVRSMPASNSLSMPTGVTVDSAGNVYVTERGAHRVAKLNASGVVVARWGTQGAGALQFNNPRGIVVDASNRLFIADTTNQRIQALHSVTGSYLGEWGYYTSAGNTLSRYIAPVGVSLTSGGDVLVTDMGMHRIERCPPTPRPPAASLPALEVWGGPPASSETSKLASPRGAALTAGGTLYVADSGNSRISRNVSGVWQQPWLGYGSEPGRLKGPTAVAVDATGVIIADTANHRLAFFDGDGGFRSIVGTFGAGPGQFKSPGGVVVHADGDILVADTANNRIQRLAPDGSFVASIGADVLSAPRGLAFTADGILLVADSGSDRIARFAEDGTLLGWYGSSGSGTGQFNGPTDVSVDPSGGLWVADRDNQRIQKLDAATGAFRFSVGTFGIGNGEFIAPEGVSALPDGSVLVADTGNTRLQHLGPDGSFVQIAGARAVSPWVPHAPTDVATSPDGRSWVCERDGALARMVVRDPDAPTTQLVGLPAGPVAANVELSLAASDAFSGVRGSYYSLDGQFPLNYVGPFTVSKEGTTVVGYYSLDRAGNREAEQTATVVIDTTPPRGTFVAAAGSAWVSTRTVSIEASIDAAFEMRVGVGSDMSDWVPFSETTSVVLPDSDGLHTVRVEYRDALRNTLPLSKPVGLDRVGPGAPPASSSTHPIGQIVRKGTTAAFSWSAPVDTSGIKGYSYVLDRVATTTPDTVIDAAGTTFQASGLTGGAWYFHVTSVDVAGNWGATRHVPIRLTSVPSISAPTAVLVSTNGSSATYRVTGIVRPLQPSTAMRVVAVRLESGRWVPRVRATAAVTSAGTASRYRGMITLGTGQWRLRAYRPYDGIFEPAWGPYGTTIDLR